MTDLNHTMKIAEKVEDIDTSIFTRVKKDQAKVRDVVRQSLLFDIPWSVIYGHTGVSFHKIRKWHGIAKVLGLGASSINDLEAEKSYLWLRESSISQDASVRISGVSKKTPVEIFESQKRLFRNTFQNVLVRVLQEDGTIVSRFKDLMEGGFLAYPLERFITEDYEYNRAGRTYEFICSDPTNGTDSMFTRVS